VPRIRPGRLACHRPAGANSGDHTHHEVARGNLARLHSLPVPAPPKARDVTGWMLRHPYSLDEDEKLKLSR